MQRILIIRNDKLGDVVLSLPLVRALRRALPQAYLGFLASAYAAPLLEKDPDLDRIFVAGRPETLSELKDGRFDVALVLWDRPANAWLAFRAGIPKRVGVSLRFFSPLFTHRLPLRRSRGLESEASLNLRFLRALGLELPDLEGGSLAVTAEDRRQAEEWLKQHGPTGRGRLVILHPGTGGSSLSWPAHFFSELGRRLVQRHGVRLLVGGAASELPLMQQVSASIEPRPALLSGTLPIRVYAAMLGQAALFVSAATGPMHLAAAMGTPTLSFFPPLRSMSPLRWAPLGNRHAVLSPPGLGFGCAPSHRGACPWGNCMELITPEMALESSTALLGSGG
jgi:ADP-heptose:LPS heptosyltransferase